MKGSDEDVGCRVFREQEDSVLSQWKPSLQMCANPYKVQEDRVMLPALGWLVRSRWSRV